MRNYKLLTPGPLTTSTTVKAEMLYDRCTWDEEYKALTQKIRKQLLLIGKVSPEKYTTILMQGSGSFAVESVLTTTVKPTDKILFLTNGAYGERMVTMAKYIGLNFIVHSVPYHQVIPTNVLETLLTEDSSITHVAFVHCETTTGILNPLSDLAKTVKAHDKILIVDAMSSFGGFDISVEELGIDFLISSSNKCIQGVPGFGFVLARMEPFLSCKDVARSLSLDLYAQWEEMDRDGKWRFTSPTHVVAAFSKAIDELIEEGGVKQRELRYRKNNVILRNGLASMGISAYISEVYQSPIISTFLYPSEEFDFDDFYHYVKEKGFVLYPGKLTDALTFRIGNIGEIYPEDMLQLLNIIQAYLHKKQIGENHNEAS